MGTIYRPQYRDRHGNYRESSIYWIQYFVGGKRERENTHSESHEDAKNLLKMREGDVGSGKLTKASHGLLFGELLDDVTTDYKINHRRSIDDLEARMPRVKTYFGDRKPLSISKAEIAKYVAIANKNQVIQKEKTRRAQLLTESSLLCAGLFPSGLKTASWRPCRGLRHLKKTMSGRVSLN